MNTRYSITKDINKIFKIAKHGIYIHAGKSSKLKILKPSDFEAWNTGIYVKNEGIITYKNLTFIEIIKEEELPDEP